MTVSEEMKKAVMPALFDVYPDMPAGVAKWAVILMAEDGLSVDGALKLIKSTIREFVPQYGERYPSVAFILGKRVGEASVDWESYAEQDKLKFMKAHLLVARVTDNDTPAEAALKINQYLKNGGKVLWKL